MNHPTTFKQGLDFRIADVSSEDPEYPASELLAASPQSKGWQTQRFATFPQYVIIQFFAPVKVGSMQLLSHQCKISSKIEIFCAMPTNVNLTTYVLDDVPFRKLGYFLLSPNEQSGFQARELKTVYLDAPMLFLKLVLQKPHINSLNVFNQVGIIGVSFTGQPLNPGMMPSIGVSRKPDLGLQSQYDAKTLSELEQLERAKGLAIAEEDFIQAKQLKEQIDQLKKHAEQLLRLEQRKEIAIQNEDYDAAMLIKQEIQKLRERINTNKQNPGNRYPESNYGRNAPPRYNDGMYDDYRNQNYEPRYEDQYNQNERYDRAPMSPNSNHSNRGFTANQRNAEPRGRSGRNNSARAPVDNNYNQQYQEQEDDRPLNNDRRYADDERPINPKTKVTQDDDRPLNVKNRVNNDDDRPLNVKNRNMIEDDRPLPALNKQPKNFDEEEYEEQPVPAMQNKRTAGRQRAGNADRRQKSSDVEDNDEFKAPPTKNNQNKNPYDDVPLPALANKKNDQMLDEYPEEENRGGGGGDEAPNVSKKNMVKLETFITKFDKSFLMQVFSSNWQHRDAACGILIEELKKISKPKSRLPSEVILSSDLESAISSTWKLNNILFEDRVPQILNQCLSVYELCITIANKNSIRLKTANEFQKTFEDMITLVMDKVSEYKNTQMLKQISTILLGSIKDKITEIDEMITQLTKTKSVAKKLLSFKHLTGRCKVLQTILRKEGNKCKNSIKELMNFCVENLENSNADVRAETTKLIVEIARVVGEEKTIKILETEGVRKQQLEKIREELENMDANAEESEDEAPPQNPVKQTTKPTKVVEKPEKPSKQVKKEESIEEEEEEEANTLCNFCHQVNPNFTNNDQYDMHLWKECPMLATCRYCNQVVEIPDLNNHMLEECSKSDNFSKCPRCQMAIENKFYDEHTSAPKCKIFNLKGNSIRCYLCQKDFPVQGNDIEQAWRDHLVVKGCSVNPRTNS